MHALRRCALWLCLSVLLFACREERAKRISPLGITTDEETAEADYDLDKIQASGELIAVTLSGPDTYYEYRGKGFGLQFELAEHFANSIGTRLRMETARDTAELFRRLQSGEADLIALELPARAAGGGDVRFAGVWHRADTLSPDSLRWVVRQNAPQLSQALDRWYNPRMRADLLAADRRRMAGNSVRRTLRAPVGNRAKGIISDYDSHFVRHSRALGWDWRLMAAQCYQESGFDPQAVSWAGARGLMQIMPGTAAHLGLPLSQIYQPEQNIAAAARLLGELERKFSDVPGRLERINFVLAAYNGGSGHVRDAMALARKHGCDPHKWADVGPFILRLSQPQYYNDPVVRFGYLRGQETFGYVKSINERWQYYRTAVPGAATTAGAVPSPSKKSLREGYKSKVLSPEELEQKSKPVQE